MLVDMQDREELRSANKLTKAHVNFQNSKMKVHLAVQTFSRSVATSLHFCREVLKLTEFADSKATEEFILHINDLSDLCNSRLRRKYRIVGPMSPKTKTLWHPFVSQISDYLLGLKNNEGAK